MKREIKVNLSKTKESNITVDRIADRIWSRYETEIKQNGLTKAYFRDVLNNYYTPLFSQIGDKKTAMQRAIKAFDMSGFYRTKDERFEYHNTASNYFQGDKQLLKKFQNLTRDERGRFTKFDYRKINNLGSFETAQGSVSVEQYNRNAFIITYNSPYERAIMNLNELKRLIPDIESKII